ncbi:MAG: flavin reductase [Cyanobacteria bacterium SZAS LIN-2]|nr:flavin reductase [Cyanobacteria bacterium SZAS LIN-3]MBS1996368.1 flavin reductase [Cyanobacteria bacterium SZAS LIN-2]MBS2007498.1 flavin reductase [Cyanobacteria bacterium SZAS TMP-1]
MTELRYSEAMAAAMLISSPVTVVTTFDKPTEKTLAMISTVSYAQLEPLALSSGVLKKSRTGRAIIESGVFAVSVVAHEQLSKLESMSLLSAGQDQDKLSAAGFEKAKFAGSGLEYIKDCLAAFSLKLVGQVELENYIALVGVVTEVMHLEDSQKNNLTALIRYNRCYGPIDKGRLKAAIDSYPI